MDEQTTVTTVMALNEEQTTNGAEAAILFSEPYTVKMAISGTADFLFHRWNNENVAEKAKASKNSKAKKTDNLESYVYRLENGELAIPGEYLRQSIINAAKYRQDPRSPRKSAMDLYKAGVVSLTQLGSIGKKKWDYEDRRRAVIQRSGITRVRPALRVGWKASFDLMVLLPEYIDLAMLLDTATNAGRLIGLGDFRPTYGRFMVTSVSAI
jgi:hypothetical protein